jgi:predicted nucleic acid-binding protein
VTLVDTSVWVEHFRRSGVGLKDLLTEGKVLCHPFVIGELACGRLRNRTTILTHLRALPETPVAEEEEVFHLLDGWRLHGRGLGWIDLHLLASARLAGSSLWTLDRPLQRAALRLGIAPR